MKFLRALKTDKRNDLIMIIVHSLSVLMLCSVLIIRSSVHKLAPDIVMAGLILGIVPILFEIFICLYFKLTNRNIERK